MFKMLLRILIALCLGVLVMTMAFGQSQPIEVIDFSDEDGRAMPPIPAELLSDNTVAPPTPAAPAGTALDLNNLPRVSADAPLSPVVEAPLAQDILFEDVSAEPLVPASDNGSAAPTFFSPNQAVESETLTTATVDQLSQAELASRGILTESEGGFGRNVWRGLNPLQAEARVRRLTEAGLHSPVARRLLQQALLVQTAPPNTANVRWLAVRAQGLQDLQLVASARLLLAGLTADQAVQDPLLAKVWARDRLLAGAAEDVCSIVPNQLRATGDSWWRQALLICQWYQGSAEAIRLSMELAPEQDLVTDPIFYSVFNALLNADLGPELQADDQISALASVLYLEAPELITPDHLPHLSDVVLRRLIQQEGALPQLRLHAAEVLVNRDVDPDDASTLRALYGAIEAVNSNDPLAAAANEPDGALARAQLWRIASDITNSSQLRAMALQQLYERALADGHAQLPQGLLPETLSLRAGSSLAWFAPQVIRYALLAGEVDTARNWWRQSWPKAAQDNELYAQLSPMRPAWLMLDNKAENAVLNQWWDAQDNAAAAVRTLNILEGAGLALPTETWDRVAKVYDDSYAELAAGPGPFWLRQVAQALESEQPGRTLLTLLQPIAHTSPAELNATGVANLLAGLRYLGRVDAAQALAIEAMLAPAIIAEPVDEFFEEATSASE